MKVCELERTLFDSFPKVDAESWDHVGLSVGDPDSTVGRVLVALDALFGFAISGLFQLLGGAAA